MSNKRFYQGAYVNDICDLVTISALSFGSKRQINSCIYGQPGCGKTEIAELSLRKIFGDVHSLKLVLSATTHPDTVKGIRDIKTTMSTGREVRFVGGSPHDPDVWAVLADEFPRATAPVLEDLAQILESKNGHRPIFIATANFSVDDEKLEHVNSRITLHQWVENAPYDVRAISSSHLWNDDLDLNYTFPTLSDIVDNNNARAGLTQRAGDVVLDFIEMLAKEALDNGVNFDRRRVSSITNMLVLTSIYESGSPDFQSISKLGMRAIKWCAELLNPDEAKSWRDFVVSISDPIQTMIDAFLDGALVEFQKYAKMSPTERVQNIAQMGAVLQNSQQNLMQKSLDTGDARCNDAIVTLNTWYALAVQGKDPRA